MTTLNEKLQLGILPDELNFTASFKSDFDIEKLRYNTFYKSPEYWLHKFENPTAFLNLPASHEILQSIIDNSVTPLEEMISRSIIQDEFGENKIIETPDNERQREESDRSLLQEE